MGEAVVGHCDPLAAPYLEPSGFSRRRKKDGEKLNRSWIAPLVCAKNPAWFCYRDSIHFL